MDNTIKDINFQQLWENARSKRSWSNKEAKDWDKKASSFARRNINAPFAQMIMQRLPLQNSDTVLDVGSGPGTLSLPIAEKVSQVTAIDYSGKMLDILADQADKRGLTNISAVQASWTDDWAEKCIIAHDIGIASRSLNVLDLRGAISKLNDFSRKFVFLADRINPTPFDPEIFKAVGRSFEPGPDYIYTINILYEMQIHPQVEILELDRELTFTGYEQALESLKWMIEALTPDEESLLRKYLDEKGRVKPDGTLTIERSHPLRWALIWWKK